MPDRAEAPSQATIGEIAGLLRDFAAYAGLRGIRAAVLAVAAAVMEGVGLALLVPIFTLVTGAAGTHGGARRAAQVLLSGLGARSADSQLEALLGGFCLLILLRVVIQSQRDLALATLQIGFVEQRRSDIMRALAGSPWHTVARLRHSRITELMSGDIQRIGNAAHALLQGLVAGLMLLVQCALALWVAPLLATITLAVLAAGSLSLIPAVRRSRGLGAEVSGANRVLLDTISQLLGGLKFAAAHGLTERLLGDFHRTLGVLTARQLAAQKQLADKRNGAGAVAALAAAGVLFLGAVVLHTPGPAIIALLVILARLTVPATVAQQSLLTVANSLAAYGALKVLEHELAAHSAAPAPPAVAAEEPITGGVLRIEGVSFQRSGGAGLKAIDLEIAPGGLTGLVGPSGAGKTTLLDLLAGLYPPTSGGVSLGGRALTRDSLQAWRAVTSYVTQDAFLFHDTLRNNLAWVAPEASEADMWRVLELAGAADFVRGLPAGLDTVAGERGMLISGGERQRIALARAVLRRPLLLLLDEATGSLDAVAERRILQRLLAEHPGMTVLLVTHRAENIDLCGRVIALGSSQPPIA